VIFQIEEDTVAKRGHLPYRFGARVAEQLAADLEHADHVRDRLREGEGGFE